MVNEKLWKQYPCHEKLERLPDDVKNALIENMLEDRAYRNGEGAHVISSDIMGRPSDVEKFKELAKLKM